MALIGDVITRVRGIANDPCQTIPAPLAPTTTIAGTGGIFSGNTFFIITYLTLWGESVGSPEFSYASLNNNTVGLSGLTPPYATKAIRVYFGFGSGMELQFLQYTVNPFTTSLVVGFPTDPVMSGAPPYKASAWLPDTDGDLVDASTMYRWMNAGLEQLGRSAGGILDQTGAAPAAGTAEFLIPGYWLRITHTWHNGWLTIAENQSYTWLQGNVTGIPGIVTLWRSSAQQVLGTWPQPSTDPATAILTAPMTAIDTMAQVNSGSFTSPGLCLIDNEVISYSTSADTTFAGMIRGVGGTLPAAHQSNTTVTQLIFRLLGRRLPAIITLGMSGSQLDVPQGWDSVLDLYLLAQFKQTEQNLQEASALMQEFEAKSIKLRDDQIPVEIKQIGGLFPFGGQADSLAEIMDTVVVN